MRLLLFIIFAITSHWHLNGQSTHLADLDIYLIGPENVNLHFKEQEAFYVEEYSKILIDSREELRLLLVEKTDLLDKKWRRKKHKRRLAEIKYIEAVIKGEISSLKEYIVLWERYAIPENSEAATQALLTDDCFEVIGEKGVYSPKEYQVVSITNDYSVDWEEVIAMQTLEEEVIKEKWIKRKADRDCYSADPNDCLVWTLVKVPETKVVKTCPSAFPKKTRTNLCIKEISVENEYFLEKRIKAYTIRTRAEIEIVEVRKIACK